MTRIRVLCFMLSCMLPVLIPAVVPASAAEKKPPAAKKAPPGRSETLACRLGSEDRHARIAVVVIKGRTDSFAYYSKWKPRTCSVYLQRRGDMFSKWADNGALTTVSLEKGTFLIEHKPGEYHFIFRDVDRERYCGMDGVINGSLTIKRGNDQCILAGDIMVEGTPLGAANLAERAPEGPLADPPPAAAAPVASAPATAAPTPAGASPAPAAASSAPTAARSTPPAAPAPAAASAAPAVPSAPASAPAAAQAPPPAPAAAAEPPQEKPVSAGVSAPAAAQSAPAAQPTAATQTASEKPPEAASANPFASFFRSLSRSRPAEEQPRTP